MAEWMEKNDITNIDLMKINIEGGEYELLDRMLEENLVKVVDNLQIQFHDISPESHSRMMTIQKGLERTHSPTYQYRFIWENWKRRT